MEVVEPRAEEKVSRERADVVVLEASLHSEIFRKSLPLVAGSLLEVTGCNRLSDRHWCNEAVGLGEHTQLSAGYRPWHHR